MVEQKKAERSMDATTLILLAKIVTDLLMTITLAIPSVSGMSEDEKKAMLAGLQTDTEKAMQALYQLATKKE